MGMGTTPGHGPSPPPTTNPSSLPKPSDEASSAHASLARALELEEDSKSSGSRLSPPAHVPSPSLSPSPYPSILSEASSFDTSDIEASSLWSAQAKEEAGTLVGGLPAAPSSVWEEMQLGREGPPKRGDGGRGFPSLPHAMEEREEALSPSSQDSLEGGGWYAADTGSDKRRSPVIPDEGGMGLTQAWGVGRRQGVAMHPRGASPHSTTSASSLDDIVAALSGSGGLTTGSMSPLWERVALEAGEISEPESASVSYLLASDLLPASVGPVTTTTIQSLSMLNISVDSLAEQPLEEALIHLQASVPAALLHYWLSYQRIIGGLCQLEDYSLKPLSVPWLTRCVPTGKCG